MSSCLCCLGFDDVLPGEGVVDLAGDIAFEAAEDVSFGQTFGGAAGDVVAGALVVAHADQDDGVQGAVGGAVTAAVEAVAVSASRGCGDGGDAGQMGEGCFRAQAVGVVSDGGQ